MTWSCVRVPCQFPVENRVIYATPVVSVTYKTKAEAYPKMARALRGLLLQHPDERVLVHTVSYDLGGYLLKSLMAEMGPAHKRLLTYRSARERDKTIERYRRVEGSVLIAPSLERGVDFRDEDCRVVVVCKVPYPNLGDAQTKARFYGSGGRLWFAVATVRSLVQMTGRGVRSETDFASSYILDAQFVDKVWKDHRTLLPTWWRDAVDMSGKYVQVFARLAEGRAA